MAQDHRSTDDQAFEDIKRDYDQFIKSVHRVMEIKELSHEKRSYIYNQFEEVYSMVISEPQQGGRNIR